MKTITLSLPEHHAHQMLDGLRCRKELYENTAKYHEGAEAESMDDLFSETDIAEVTDAHEAHSIADFYGVIITSIEHQMKQERRKPMSLMTTEELNRSPDECDSCTKEFTGETYQDKTGNLFVCQECFDKSNDGTYYIKAKEKVIITVQGGVAQLEEKPNNVIVQIIDYDYMGNDDRLVPDPLSPEEKEPCCVVSEYE